MENEPGHLSSALKNPSLLRQSAYINGAWVKAKDNKTFSVIDPSSRQTIANVPDLSADDCRHAIECAATAFPAWRDRTAKERAVILRRWFNLCVENQEDLARLLTAEQGKPLAESRGEVSYGASFIEWFAEEGKRIYGDIIPATKAGQRILVTKQAVGVCAAITPWNFPVAMITRKVSPALAAGCTVVVKPAESTPLCALALAALAEEAGIPAGVFNVITSNQPAAIGAQLSGNRLIKTLSFTSSTKVGKMLMKQCAESVKKLSLELGGNAPFIIFADADLGAAVQGAMASKFRNSGQTCVCVNRILVQNDIYDAFADRLCKAVAELRTGHGTADGTTQGPLINDAAVAKVEEHIEDAKSKGASIVAGGKRHSLGGTFFEPTVLTNVNAQMKVAREETFGPVAALFRFDTEDEAINMANDTELGMAAYCYTKDLGRAMRVSEKLEYGIVGINEGIISTEVAPFGGMKESGLGREGSKYGIEEYVELKYVLLGGLARD